MTDWLAAPPLLLNFEQAALPLGQQDELVFAGAYSAEVRAAMRAMGFRFAVANGEIELADVEYQAVQVWPRFDA